MVVFPVGAPGEDLGANLLPATIGHDAPDNLFVGGGRLLVFDCRFVLRPLSAVACSLANASVYRRRECPPDLCLQAVEEGGDAGPVRGLRGGAGQRTRAGFQWSSMAPWSSGGAPRARARQAPPASTRRTLGEPRAPVSPAFPGLIGALVRLDTARRRGRSSPPCPSTRVHLIRSREMSSPEGIEGRRRRAGVPSAAGAGHLGRSCRPEAARRTRPVGSADAQVSEPGFELRASIPRFSTPRKSTPCLGRVGPVQAIAMRGHPPARAGDALAGYAVARWIARVFRR